MKMNEKSKMKVEDKIDNDEFTEPQQKVLDSQIENKLKHESKLIQIQVSIDNQKNIENLKLI